jgi:DNA-binding transcriptional regulator GbsR (MarR family)
MQQFAKKRAIPIFFAGREYVSIEQLAKTLNISLPHVSQLLQSGMGLDEALKLCKRTKIPGTSVKSTTVVVDKLTKTMKSGAKTKLRTIKNFDNYEDLKPHYARMANEEIRVLQLQQLHEDRKQKLTPLLPEKRQTFASLANNYPHIKSALFELQSSLKTGSLCDGHNVIMIRAPKEMAMDVTCAGILSIHRYINTDIKIETLATFLELTKPWELHTGVGSNSIRKFEQAVKTKALFFDLGSPRPSKTEQQSIGKVLRARRTNKLTVITVFHERPLILWCGDFLLESLKEAMFTDISLFD